MKTSKKILSFKEQNDKLGYAYLICIAALTPLNAIYFSILALNPSDYFCTICNSFLPLYFMFLLGALGWRILDLMVESIWTAAFWFPIQSLLMFGFGPLVETYGNVWTRNLLAESELAVSPLELLGSNALSTLGVTLILLGFWLHMSLRRASWDAHNHWSLPIVDPDRVGGALVLGGAVLKYLILKPSQWGMINIVVPGFISQMGSIIDIGFAIMAMSQKRFIRRLLLTIWPIHFFLCILSFAKTEIVFAMLMVQIGAYVRHAKKQKLLVGLAIIAIVFTVSQPWISYGREISYAKTGNIDNVNYIERIYILSDYISTDIYNQNSTNDPDTQGWWQRLSSAGPQAHAMDLHDRGYSGSSLSNAWMYFIPRWIWLDKPILPGPGIDYYRLVTGNSAGESFLGLSVYGDLYWQFGWAGVLVGCPIIGWLFAVLNARSLRSMRDREFVMFPLVLCALLIALTGPGEFVVSGIIGPLPIYIAYYFAILVWVQSMQRRRHAIKMSSAGIR